MARDTIVITEPDRHKLSALIQDLRDRGEEILYANELAQELARARIVTPDETDPGVITMNSRFRLTDLDDQETEEYTLVFPHEADIGKRRISVLSPVGTGLLGYRKGDVVEWPVPDGTRRLKIEDILYQPEAAGDRHL
jgi:regulator of nucleoside diphosphate kinase